MKSFKQRLKKNEVNINVRYTFYCFEKLVKTLDQAHVLNLSVCNNGAVGGQSARGCILVFWTPGMNYVYV